MELATGRPWWPLGDADQFGEAVRHWLSNNWDPSITVGMWWERLGQAGLAAPTWPRGHGGIAATLPLQQVLEQEMAAIGAVAPPVHGEGLRVVGPALREHGTPEQHLVWLPRLLTGIDNWCLLLDEVDTEWTATTTRIELDWKHATLTGTKLCPAANLATHGLVIGRSGSVDDGVRGLTAIAIDMTADGVRIDGDLVHLDGVRSDLATHLVGQPGGGRQVARTALPYRQRSLAGRVRRGLVNVTGGSLAGNLDRVIADVLGDIPRPRPPDIDRRAR